VDRPLAQLGRSGTLCLVFHSLSAIFAIAQTDWSSLCAPIGKDCRQGWLVCGSWPPREIKAFPYSWPGIRDLHRTAQHVSRTTADSRSDNLNNMRKDNFRERFFRQRARLSPFFTEICRLASIEYSALGRFLPTLGHKTNNLRRTPVQRRSLGSETF